MILKGSQRGGGQNLAVHLLRLDENEHMELHELRGFAADDLKGAFKEAEATSLGTKCSQYLFSLSLSPPEDARVPVAAFEAAIDRIEASIGLEGQPRAIVFHEKDGRRHAHCVWSRIDADTMTARQLSFFKTKLMAISRELYLEHGWKMPAGIERAGARNPTNFTLGEWQQAKRSGLDPRWLKEAVQLCWKSSDSPRAFQNALEGYALKLAKGDRRGFVVVDFNGEVHSLARQLCLKTKDVEARLAKSEGLKGVDGARKEVAEKMTPALRGHVKDARAQFEKRSGKLGNFKAEMTQLHRTERVRLEERHRREWDNEVRARAARLPKGIRGLWHRLTGEYGRIRSANELEATETRLRHAAEREALVFRQLDQRALLQSKFRALRGAQAELLMSLRRDLARFHQFTKSKTRGRALDETPGLGLRR